MQIHIIYFNSIIILDNIIIPSTSVSDLLDFWYYGWYCCTVNFGGNIFLSFRGNSFFEKFILTEFSFGMVLVILEKYQPNTDRKYRNGTQL